ncbi:MAG: hypothetical protein U9R42_13435 [Bacteroidota bacterium]|nr:hypothetical protein [Bacteroidota bacterium]
MKYFFKLIIFVFLTFVSFSLFSQNKTEDIIKLKNGNIFRGKIIEKDSNIIKIETRAMNTLVFNKNEILEVSKINIQPISNLKNYGYSFSVKLGSLSGNSNYYGMDNAFTIQFVNAYSFSNRLSCAITTGLEVYDKATVPLMASFSFDILDNDLTPFVYCDGGYSFSLSPSGNGYEYYSYDYKYKGGYVINPGVGMKKYFNNNTAFVLSIGYRNQKLRQIRTYKFEPFTVNEIIDIYNRISIHLGLIFM